MLVAMIGLLVSVWQVMFNFCPPTTEWPAGISNGMARTSDRHAVVILRGADRVQVYDEEWRFVRGWNVGARGKLLGLHVGAGDIISLFTSRARIRYTIYGEIVASTPVADEERPERPLLAWVPGSPWYWFLLNPVVCMVIALLGLCARLLTTPRLAPRD